MCIGAIIFAGIDRVVYGASIPAIQAYVPQIELRCTEVVAKGFRPVEVVGGVLEAACLGLFEKRDQ
jgi:guanine deaminase